jgi:hypothetical protein
MMKLYVENNAEATFFKMVIMGSKYYANNPKKIAKYERIIAAKYKRILANVTHIESSDDDEGPGDGEDGNEEPGDAEGSHVESSDNDEGPGDVEKKINSDN